MNIGSSVKKIADGMYQSRPLVFLRNPSKENVWILFIVLSGIASITVLVLHVFVFYRISVIDTDSVSIDATQVLHIDRKSLTETLEYFRVEELEFVKFKNVTQTLADPS
jgi:hypothetical protein